MVLYNRHYEKIVLQVKYTNNHLWWSTSVHEEKYHAIHFIMCWLNNKHVLTLIFIFCKYPVCATEIEFQRRERNDLHFSSAKRKKSINHKQLILEIRKDISTKFQNNFCKNHHKNLGKKKSFCILDITNNLTSMSFILSCLHVSHYINYMEKCVKCKYRSWEFRSQKWYHTTVLIYLLKKLKGNFFH